MYIEQANKGKTDWWRYPLGILIVFIGVGIFSAPHSMAIAAKTMNGEVDTSKVGDINYLFSLFDANLNLLYVTLPFAGGLLFLYLATRFIHKLPFKTLTTSRPKIDFKRVLFSFALWGGVSLLFILISYFLNPEQMLWNFQPQKFAILVLVAVVMIPIQTSFEEYVFRGYLMQGLGIATKTRWLPLIITSVTFGLLHIANPEVEKLGMGVMVFYIGTGFLLGVITLLDEGMELSLGFHAANNLITALLVTTDWTAFQTYALFKDISEPSLGGELIAVLCAYPLLLLVFAKKYGWKDWRSKLV